MAEKGYTRSEYDPRVYFRKLSSDEYVYLLMYVDEILITSRSRTVVEKLKTQLSVKI